MAVIAKSDTNATTPGEFVYEMFSEVHCTKSAKVQNDSTVGGAAATNVAAGLNPVGQPVRLASGVWEFSSEVLIDAGTIHGVIIDDTPVLGQDNLGLAANATTIENRRILVKGPATINDNKIPTTDIYGTALDAAAKAAYITALNALGIEVRDNTGLTSAQST